MNQFSAVWQDGQQQVEQATATPGGGGAGTGLSTSQSRAQFGTPAEQTVGPAYETHLGGQQRQRSEEPIRRLIARSRFSWEEVELAMTAANVLLFAVWVYLNVKD